MNFRNQVEEIPNEIWDYEFIGKDEKWLKIKSKSEEILKKIGVKSRDFKGKYHKVIGNGGIIYQEPDTEKK